MNLKKISLVLVLFGVLIVGIFQNCSKVSTAVIEKSGAKIQKTSIESQAAIQLILEE